MTTQQNRDTIERIRGYFMDTLYLDCRMGITGAKIFGALVDLMDNPNAFIYDFNKLGLSGVSVEILPDALNGIKGIQLEFRRRSSNDLDMYDEELDDDETERRHRRRGRSLQDITEIIDDMAISNEVADRAIHVYESIFKAYAKANNRDESTVRLHRTASKDVIASIVGSFVALEKLKPEKVIVSTVAVGAGYTRTPRGKMPIPIPEIQLLLDDIPYTAGTEENDLCTMCGAALISEIADESGNFPEMDIAKSGAGFGVRTFKSGVNCVRAYLGKFLFTSANSSYIKLTADLFDSVDLVKLGEGLEKVDINSICITEVSRLDGAKGRRLEVLCSNDNADSIATYIIENTDTKQVMRQIVSAYSE